MVNHQPLTSYHSIHSMTICHKPGVTGSKGPLQVPPSPWPAYSSSLSPLPQLQLFSTPRCLSRSYRSGSDIPQNPATSQSGPFPFVSLWLGLHVLSPFHYLCCFPLMILMYPFSYCLCYITCTSLLLATTYVPIGWCLRTPC